MGLARIRVVLVRPRTAGNVGAAARALKNMGLSRLVVAGAAPIDRKAAAIMAVHASDVLDAMQSFATVPEAIADCGLVVGTCGRTAMEPYEPLTPRALAPQIVAAAATNDVALVFGPEDHGLSNDELALCQRVISIPTSDAERSLNLAQAVVVCAYEIFVAATSGREGAASLARGDRAESRRLEFMYARLEAALQAIGFLHRDNAVHMMRRIRRILGRADLDDPDVEILLGVARQIAWAASHTRVDAIHAPHLVPTTTATNKSAQPYKRSRARTR